MCDFLILFIYFFVGVIIIMKETPIFSKQVIVEV